MQDELDILREVERIAAAHGSIALSEMLGKKINLSIPTVDIVSCALAPEKIDLAKMGIGIISRFPTGLKGEAVFILDEKNAFKLISLSYKIGEGDKNLACLLK